MGVWVGSGQAKEAAAVVAAQGWPPWWTVPLWLLGFVAVTWLIWRVLNPRKRQ